MASQIERLQDELHELERRMESLRRRIWAVENGLELVEDPETEVKLLRAEFDEAGKQFTLTYRAWSKEHAAE